MQKLQKKEDISFANRYYEAQFPEKGQIVVCLVSQVQENASYVKLLQYGGRIGMIAPNQQSKSQRRGQYKALKKGKEQVVRVLQVDKERGFIDLSKKGVNTNQQKQTLDNYAKRKLLNSMFIGVSESMKIDVMKLYTKIAWPLERKQIFALQFFKRNLEELDSFIDQDITPEVIGKLRVQIQRRLKPAPHKIVSVIQLSVDHFRGIQLIKQALTQGQKIKINGHSVKYFIKGSPKYQATIETINDKLGKEVMIKANQRVGQFISQFKGQFKIKEEPKILGAKGRVEQQEQKVQQQDEYDEEDSGMGSSDQGGEEK